MHYLPDEKELVGAVEGDLRGGKIPGQRRDCNCRLGTAKPIFCAFIRRLYVGARLSPGAHLHAHFAGMAARTAYWIRQFFNVPFSFTAHANDIFVPRSFAIGLDRLVDAASAVITETDYAGIICANVFRKMRRKSSAFTMESMLRILRARTSMRRSR